MPKYLGNEVHLSHLRELVAAYGGKRKRTVPRKAVALLIKYLEVAGVSTVEDARALGEADAIAPPTHQRQTWILKALRLRANEDPVPR